MANDNGEVNTAEKTLNVKKHVTYFKRCSEILPSACQSLDSNRMTILFFSLSGLDVLNSLYVIDDRRNDIIDWIYAQQVTPTSTSE
jgi:geranylgeranyl transferase type-1 subunit beta